jgi:Holliday junction resolvasome RuvABC endonuclease subunit
VIALGIDPGSRRTAVSGLTDAGAVTSRVLAIPADLRGARRLVHARNVLAAHLAEHRDVAVVAVEIPWGGARSSFVLLSLAGVILEAAQTAHPGAVVLELTTGEWKRETVGHGAATKEAVLEHAHGIGLVGDDQDAADALCMAQAAFERWTRALEQARRAAA